MKRWLSLLLCVLVFGNTVGTYAETVYADPSEKGSGKIENVIETIKEGSENVADEVSDLVDALGDKAKETMEDVGALGDKAKETIEDTVNTVVETGSQVTSTITQTAEDAKNAVQEKAGQLTDGTTSALKKAGSRIRDLRNSFDREKFEKGWEEAAELLRRSAAAAGEAIDDLSFRKKVEEGLQDMRDTLSEQFSGEEPREPGSSTGKEGSADLQQILSGEDPTTIHDAGAALGAELLQILRQAVKDGELDPEILKEFGLEALSEASGGFLEGSISTAIYIACREGRFGDAFTEITPALVGKLTALVLDAATNTYLLSQGEITAAEYAEIMTKEILVITASVGTGILAKSLFPMIPGMYFAGCFVGSILAENGFELGKAVVLSVINEDGLDILLPSQERPADSAGRKEQLVDLAETVASYAKLIVPRDENIKIRLQYDE